MTPKEFQKYLARDGHCWHCGSTDDDLIPHHRKNRQMGSKNSSANKDSNVIVMCQFNFLMEADAVSAARARHYGWKLESYEDPETKPVYDAYVGEWYLLKNGFRRVEFDNQKTTDLDSSI